MYILINRIRYFRGAKIMLLSHMANTCVTAMGMWGKMMMRKDVSKRYMFYYVMQKCVAGFSVAVVRVLSTVCC